MLRTAAGENEGRQPASDYPAWAPDVFPGEAAILGRVVGTGSALVSPDVITAARPTPHRLLQAFNFAPCAGELAATNLSCVRAPPFCAMC